MGFRILVSVEKDGPIADEEGSVAEAAIMRSMVSKRITVSLFLLASPAIHQFQDIALPRPILSMSANPGSLRAPLLLLLLEKRKVIVVIHARNPFRTPPASDVSQMAGLHQEHSNYLHCRPM